MRVSREDRWAWCVEADPSLGRGGMGVFDRVARQRCEINRFSLQRRGLVEAREREQVLDEHPHALDSSSIRRMASAVSASSRVAPIRNSSAYPRIDASGVRSSCEASARNCRSRSSLALRWAKACSRRSSIAFSASPSRPTSVREVAGLTRRDSCPAAISPAVISMRSSGRNPSLTTKNAPTPSARGYARSPAASTSSGDSASRRLRATAPRRPSGRCPRGRDHIDAVAQPGRANRADREQLAGRHMRGISGAAGATWP